MSPFDSDPNMSDTDHARDVWEDRHGRMYRDEHYAPEPAEDDEAAREVCKPLEPSPEDWADYERHLDEMARREPPPF